MSEGDWKHPMLFLNISEEGANEAYQQGEEQEGDEEEGDACNFNCDVSVMVFSCYMIFLWF